MLREYTWHIWVPRLVSYRVAFWKQDRERYPGTPDACIP